MQHLARSVTDMTSLSSLLCTLNICSCKKKKGFIQGRSSNSKHISLQAARANTQLLSEYFGERYSSLTDEAFFQHKFPSSEEESTDTMLHKLRATER